MTRLPRPDDIVEITEAAGPACRPMLARVIKVHDVPVWEGWAWLTVREVGDGRYHHPSRLAYVNTVGVRVVRSAETAARTRARIIRAANAGPAYIPRQRTTSNAGGIR